MKGKLKNAYMEVAKTFSNCSTAKRLKVGAILVKNGNIISFSYNGTPSGFDNECEDLIDGKLVTKSIVLHAEENLLMKIAKSNESSEDSIMFVTHSPCIKCARLIYQAGIKKVYYEEEYRDISGVEFLRDKCKIEVEKM
jgi:dCMP deaminase